jgi:hypothetical protein
MFSGFKKKQPKTAIYNHGIQYIYISYIISYIATRSHRSGDAAQGRLDCCGTLADVADAGEAPGSFALGEDVFGISFGCLRTYAAIKELVGGWWCRDV